MGPVRRCKRPVASRRASAFGTDEADRAGAKARHAREALFVVGNVQCAVDVAACPGCCRSFLLAFRLEPEPEPQQQQQQQERTRTHQGLNEAGNAKAAIVDEHGAASSLVVVVLRACWSQENWRIARIHTPTAAAAAAARPTRIARPTTRFYVSTCSASATDYNVD